MNEISPGFGTNFEQTGDPNSPGLDYTSDLQKNTRYLEFHQITRGCLYSSFEYFGGPPILVRILVKFFSPSAQDSW